MEAFIEGFQWFAVGFTVTTLLLEYTKNEY